MAMVHLNPRVSSLSLLSTWSCRALSTEVGGGKVVRVLQTATFKVAAYTSAWDASWSWISISPGVAL